MRIVEWIALNDATAKALGMDKHSDVLGKSDRDFHPPELADELMAKELEIVGSGEALRDDEHYLIDPETGEKRWFLSSKIPIQKDNGTLERFVGITVESTRRRIAEEENERKAELIAAQQQALLEISTPILPVFDRVLIVPLIGTIDSQRAANIMRSLLAGISAHRAKVIILDITGVPLIDTGVADYLNRTIQAARLKGAEAIITGVSDAVAETLVDLGIVWEYVETLRDLQSGLHRALEKRLDD